MNVYFKQGLIIVVASLLCLTACTKLSNGGVLLRVEGPTQVDSSFGYYSDGEKESGPTFVNDVFILRDVVDDDDIDYYPKAYSYQGLVGRNGCYLYYLYRVSYELTSKYQFTFMGDGLCKYEEIRTIDNGSWFWRCTSCNYPNSSYASAVGSYGSKDYSKATKVTRSITYSVIENPVEFTTEAQYVLYADDTYIEIFVKGGTAHAVKRLPYVEDMGTFLVQ